MSNDQYKLVESICDLEPYHQKPLLNNKYLTPEQVESIDSTGLIDSISIIGIKLIEQERHAEYLTPHFFSVVCVGMSYGSPKHLVAGDFHNHRLALSFAKELARKCEKELVDNCSQQSKARVDGRFVILDADIGSFATIPGWPEQNIDGLFHALRKFELEDQYFNRNADPMHPHAAFNAPCRCLAWCDCYPAVHSETGARIYIGTKPQYSEHPNAVSYNGNFKEHSFGFSVITDDPELIRRLDDAIAKNIECSRKFGKSIEDSEKPCDVNPLPMYASVKKTKEFSLF